jgi:hypothetical protein
MEPEFIKTRILRSTEERCGNKISREVIKM